MPKRDLSPAAVAEILHAKFTEDGTVTSMHRMRETLATSTEARGREWTERALRDGAVVSLVTHRETGRVLAVEVPRDDDTPPDTAAETYAGIGLDRRSGMTYTLWADTEWSHLAPPVIDWQGNVHDRNRGPTGYATSSGHFIVAREDVEAVCRVVMDRKAAEDAERIAEGVALDAFGVGALRDALTAAGVDLNGGAWHAMMTAQGTPTVMVTLRGQANIEALTGALTTTERNPA